MEQMGLTQMRHKLFSVGLENKEINLMMEELTKMSSGGYVGPDQVKKAVRNLRDKYILSEVDEEKIKEKIIKPMQQ